MSRARTVRYSVIAVLLLLGVFWSISSAQTGATATSYPNSRFLVTASWLQAHLQDPRLLVIDCRADKDFDGKAVAGAIRMPWSLFRETDAAGHMADVFVGLGAAQEILGEHGVTRDARVVLYDSVAKDGGATASYIFWILDVLGHPNMALLDGGIDAWTAAGGATTATPASRDATTYQAPADEIHAARLIAGDAIYPRLGDRYYQLLDVRSEAEYLGQKANEGLDGKPLKLGHIPTAVDVNYTTNWVDEKTKKVKTYAELQQLYRGLDPNRAVIPYCHSGRRSSYTYFILRLMGFEDVRLYEKSWFEWGNHATFYPVETTKRVLEGALPGTTGKPAGASVKAVEGQQQSKSGGGGAGGGYVSCGG